MRRCRTLCSMIILSRRPLIVNARLRGGGGYAIMSRGENMEKTSEKRARLVGLDELRGIAMILVVVYHLLWALSMNGYIGNPDAVVGHLLIGRTGAFMFILISGACCGFTKKPFIRAFKILGCALLVWAAIEITKISEPINFGVLHMLGCCSLIFALGRKLFEKINPIAGAAVCGLLFAALYRLPRGYILWFDAPRALYSTKWLFWLGLPHASYTASDYFPLIPWVFLFFFGWFVWRIFKSPPRFLEKSRCRPLAFVGRHTLIIYLVHQPIFFGIIMLVQLLIK